MPLFRSKLVFATTMIFLVVISAWHFKPSLVAPLLVNLAVSSYGLEKKSVLVDGREIAFLEGGQGETIVLVHGIFSRKENWLELAKELVKHHHVLALDLPGFGENDILKPGEYKIPNQAKNLLSVFNTLKVNHAHLAANSMGAQLLGSIAQRYPEKVLSLAFIGSPLGVSSPQKSEMENAIQNNLFPLIVKDEIDFFERNEWVAHKPVEIPSPILKYWAQAEVKHSGENERIWDEVHNREHLQDLLSIATTISVKTLILWCDKDRVFHVSGAKVLAAAFDNGVARIMTDCGHLPMIDRPHDVAKTYLKFLSQTSDE